MFRKKSKQEAGRLSALSAFERLRLEDSDVDETSTTTSEYGPQPSEHAYTSSTSSTGESTILTPSSSGSTLRTSPFRSGSTMGSGRPLSSVFQSALSSSTLSSVPTRMSSMRSQSQQSTSSASTNSMYHKIIIGVDYGTTYTGVSYVATSGNDPVVHVIRAWPGLGGNNVWKVPSRIAYAHENSNLRVDEWGFNVSPSMVSCSWTKLLLDRNNARQEYDDPDLFQSQGEGFLRLPAATSANTVSTDYLRKIYEYTLQTLTSKLHADIIRVTPFEFWFSIPAIWSDAAKDATINAARLAGFASRPGDEIRLIPEPEAAAIATLREYANKGSASILKVGDNVLICDAGGGTVDITSYSIKSMQPLQFNEAVIGTGAKCGATYIDRQFHIWMSQIFGAHFTNLAFEKKGPGSRFMRAFDDYKHDFGNSQNLDRVYDIPLVMRGVEDSEYYDAEEHLVKIRGYEMRDFFTPAVTCISGLLSEQIAEARQANRPINRVVLVGGFGASKYLFREIQELCTTEGLPDPVCVEHPQAAIVTGAALRGLETITPPARISRQHYGFQMRIPFREGIDPESSSYFCDYRNQKQCNNRVTWQVKKRQHLTAETKLTQVCHWRHWEDESFVKSLELYSTRLEQAPDWTTTAGVEKLGDVEVLFREEDLESTKTKSVDGRKLSEIRCNVEVIMDSKEGYLQYRAVRDGRVLGSTSIRYMEDSRR